MIHKDQTGQEWSIDGTDEGYPKMKDSHLKNCINYIIRNATRYADENEGYVDQDKWADMMGFASALNGDMASYYANQACDSYPEHGESHEDLYEEYLEAKGYDIYLKELFKRNL